MVTVSHLVNDELKKNPLLLDLLSQGLLNISALAEKIEPRISSTLCRKVKLSAVSMAIRRNSGQFGNAKILAWKFPSDLEISTKSSIYELAIRKESSFKAISELKQRLAKRTGSFLSVVEGTHETVLITNQSNKELVKKSLKKREILSEKNNLSCISVNFEKNTKNIPGIYYRLTRALAFNNISIQSMHTIGSEMLIFFEDKVSFQAVSVIRTEMENKPILG